MTLVPQTYADWRHCITVACGIPLTPAYIRARIDALEDPRDDHTRRFVERWGRAHHERTLGWFREALRHQGAA
ncbi:hypothetical protein [Falsirhodobacter sp. 20TX0035]|uniref:hypothetical protein n=1 Tax=Falsirhodobacter sp. 20TX0035 TaxID=3022019 RepID=UPI00232E3CA9|nr:hypothetical protein [Falsirhodobacter sp. 20TX0035]MDB6454234.1 hypothetical protein [Falsirhodobacter sp. 20TX0035]